MRKQTTKRRAAVVSRRALVCCVAFLAGAQVFSGGRAGAGTASGTTATGSDGGKTVSVGVSTSSSSPGAPGGATGVHGGSTGASCTYIPVPADADFVPGGPTPGQWYVVTCPGEQLELSDGGLVWIVTASHDVPVPDDSAPAALAERAAASISLPVPEIQLNPASFSVVRLQIFLAIAADIWHPFEATATSGGVTASAVATPVTVRWTMGDGGSVQCNRSPGRGPSNSSCTSPCIRKAHRPTSGRPPCGRTGSWPLRACTPPPRPLVGRSERPAQAKITYLVPTVDFRSGQASVRIGLASSPFPRRMIQLDGTGLSN